MSILIVESSPEHSRTIQDFLEQGGFTDVLFAESAYETIRLLEADYSRHLVKIDLILMDTHLAGMSGIEVCRQIRATDQVSEVPIIMVAGEDDYGNLQPAFAVGATDYITKPIRKVELLARVRSTLMLKQEMDERKARENDVLESIRYAEMIQKSLLPNPEFMNTLLPDSFIIWKPRDIVGGDIYYADELEQGFILAVIDCTGHGVPGGFMTMIAFSGIKRIIADEGCYLPGEILYHLNVLVKTTLQQDTEYALSDDGLDAAVCLVNPEAGSMIYAGARLPLYYYKNGKEGLIKPDRHSIGYKRSNLSYDFTNHSVMIEKGMTFYLATDGFIEQPGGPKEVRFGKNRFKHLIRECGAKPFDKQREAFLNAYHSHRGRHEPVDDVTVIGFSCSPELEPEVSVVTAEEKKTEEMDDFLITRW